MFVWFILLITRSGFFLLKKWLTYLEWINKVHNVGLIALVHITKIESTLINEKWSNPLDAIQEVGSVELSALAHITQNSKFKCSDVLILNQS